MRNPTTTAVIANPAARGGWVDENRQLLSDQLLRTLGKVSIHWTTAPGQGTAIAKRLVAERYETLISLGGDGTHSEIVEGIMQAGAKEPVSLGILNAGTGGDFRRMVQGSDDLLGACELIQSAPGIPVDLGWVRYQRDDGQTASRHFLNITSMGMSGLVDRYVAKAGIRSGRTAYLLATLRAQTRYKPARIRLRIDGESKGEHEVSVLCVCNGRWAGGGMMFAPDARLADGLFDVIVIGASSMLRGLPVMAGLYRGTHLRSSLVQSFRGKHVEVEVLKNTAWMDIDGEAPGTGPAEFRLIPRAIRLIGLNPDFA